MRGPSALRSTFRPHDHLGRAGAALGRWRAALLRVARSLIIALAAVAALVGLGAGSAAVASPALRLLVLGTLMALLGWLVISLRDARNVGRDRDADLASVHEAGQRLTRPMSSDALCLEVARAASRLTGATFGRLVLTSPGRSRIILLAATGPDGESIAQGERAAALELGASRGLALEAASAVRVGRDRRAPVALPAWYPVSSTYVAVPIVIDGETRGELVAAEKRGGRGFTKNCEMLLSIYAVEAAGALKSALLSEAVDEALEVAHAERSRSGVVIRRGDAVLEIARRLTETLDRATVLQTIVGELNHNLATDAATIRILDGEELRVAAWAGMTDAEAAKLPGFRRDEGWFADVIGSGRTWSAGDLRNEARFAASYERYDGVLPWRGDIVAPLIHSGKVIGAISAVTRAPRTWTDDDVDFVGALAAHASIAIHNAELFARTEGLTRELRGLVEMSSDLTRSLDSAQVADRIARHLAVAMDVPTCRISYWEREGDRLVPLGHFPHALAWEVGVPDGDAADAHDADARRVLREQVAVEMEPEHVAGPAGGEARGSPRVSLLPLVANGASIGLVELRGAGPERLDPARLELGRTMANEAAMALENARLYEVARDQADRDQLTGFFNHRALHQRLGEEVVRAQRSRTALGVLMLDIDDFKLVNDTFGHLFGDRVLHWAAEVIRSTLRLSDVAARYGGDEFAVLLPDADVEAADAIGARITAAFAARSFEWDGRGPLPIAVSVGAAAFPADGRSGQQLIAAADRALYGRKQALKRTVAAPRRPRSRTHQPKVSAPA